MTAHLFIDAAHLLAASGRSAGLGPGRVRGRFDVDELVRQVLALLPEAQRRATVHWYDAAGGGLRPVLPRPELQCLVPVLLPLVGARQRHVEAALLRDVMLCLDDPLARPLYLVGDPRRHALSLQLAREDGIALQLIGVAEGETTPAPRLWVRRRDVLRAVRDPRPRRRSAPMTTPQGGYQRPSLRTTPVNPRLRP